MANSETKRKLEIVITECFKKAEEKKFRDLNFSFPKNKTQKEFFKQKLKVLNSIDEYSQHFLSIHTKAKIALREFKQSKFDGAYLELLRLVLHLSDKLDRPNLKSIRVYDKNELPEMLIGDEVTATKEEEEEEEEEQVNEKIRLSEVKEDKSDDEYEINFNDEKSVDDFTSQKTKESQNTKSEESSGFGGKSTEEIRKDISDAETKANEIDPETFYDVADFIMTLVDSSFASAFKWWSKDSSDSAYSLPVKKKEKLTKQLANILIKYNAKFSIELMFVVGLLIMYIPAWRLAKERKKEIAAIMAKPAPVIRKENIQKVEPIIEYQNQNQNPIVEDTEKIEEEISENLEVVKPKRKNSRPRKA